ncbi:MAG: hypothetical protein HYZ49_02265 [Chloroflexi bacterium]|nr:hypothetical protein [Chloroflexota bacterium]
MKSNIRPFLALGIVAILVASLFGPQTVRRAYSEALRNNVLQHALNVELGYATPAKYEQQLSSGAMYAILEQTGVFEDRVAAAIQSAGQGSDDDKGGSALSRSNTQGCQNVFTGDGRRNIRVNQDCSLRRQAEEVIAIDPNDNRHLIAGANDSRIGFNHCSYAWSFDRGRSWGDYVPPFWQFIMADGHTSDACSDPTVTFDADSNAYIAGVIFDINSAASAFVVAKANADTGGTFFHTPAALPFQEYRDFPLGVVASDNNPNVFHDKEFIVADDNMGSPKKNNVYATWTRFDFDTGAGVGAHSPIFFSQSTNGGATWSAGIEINGSNATDCGVFSGEADPNACDQDQGSHPIVGDDGTIYVAFGNGNTPLVGVNQVMMVSCPASANCSLASSWTAPVKVGDLIDNHPTGPSPAGCPAFRQCLPPNGYRVPEFTSISISVDEDNNLYTVWSDFRNGGGTCTGSAATATPPCDNDVFYAFSTDGGAGWSGTFQITPAGSAQWQPWSEVTHDGKALWVAYYDRSFGNCEFTGCNDITLAKIKHPASKSPSVSFKRLTTGSMPNLTPANNPLQAGFLGDYMWVDVDQKDNRPYVVWADTRGRGTGAVEEDIYFALGPKP